MRVFYEWGMKPVNKSQQQKVPVGMLILADKEGDRHSVPIPQIRCITDWKKEWGDDVAAIVLYDSGPFPSVLRVRMTLEQLTETFQHAAAGAVIDLTALSGKEAYEKREEGEMPFDLSGKIKYVFGAMTFRVASRGAPLPAPEDGEDDGSRVIKNPQAIVYRPS